MSRCLLFSHRMAGLAALAVLVVPAAAQTITKEVSFSAGGKPITVEQFAPAGERTYPAIILLHGSDGLREHGFVYRRIAQDWAGQGYLVLLVHYFDRTGTTRVGAKDIKREHFQAWQETVAAAVRYAADHPRVDRRRIGLLGFSLGAYLSLGAATQPDLPIAAVIDLFGGLPASLHNRFKRLPPTLILHGDADCIVPVQEALALEKLLQDRKLPYEIKIYKGQEHLFRKDPFGADVQDAQRRSRDFFAKYLRGSAAAPTRR